MGTLLQFKLSTLPVERDENADLEKRGIVVSIFKNKRAAEVHEDPRKEIKVADPTDWRALNDAGQEAHLGGDPQQGLRYYELALLHSDEAILYFNAGVALQDLGDGDGAVAYYRRCLKEDETYRDAHANLSGLLESRGDPEASKHLERYQELGGE